jgi:DNA-binding protein Fis
VARYYYFFLVCHYGTTYFRKMTKEEIRKKVHELLKQLDDKEKSEILEIIKKEIENEAKRSIEEGL